MALHTIQGRQAWHVTRCESQPCQVISGSLFSVSAYTHFSHNLSSIEHDFVSLAETVLGCFLSLQVCELARRYRLVSVCSHFSRLSTRQNTHLTSKLDPPQDEEDEDGDENNRDARTNHHPHHLKGKRKKDQVCKGSKVAQ